MTTQYKNHLAIRQKANMLVFAGLFSASLLLTAASAIAPDPGNLSLETKTTRLLK